MTDYSKIKDFLKEDHIQDLLAKDDIDNVYANFEGNNKYLTSFFMQHNINVFDYLTYIPVEAFSGLAIRSLDLSSTNVDVVDGKAFEDCHLLSNVNLGKVIYVGINAFAGCPLLKSIDIPESVQILDNYCFSASGLERIHLPKSLKRLGYGAFYNNKELKSVTTDLPHEELVDICDDDLKVRFTNCPNLSFIQCSNGIINAR